MPKTRDHVFTIASKGKGAIASGEFKRWNDVPFEIPPVPPSGLSGCNFRRHPVSVGGKFFESFLFIWCIYTITKLTRGDFKRKVGVDAGKLHWNQFCEMR